MSLETFEVTELDESLIIIENKTPGKEKYRRIVMTYPKNTIVTDPKFTHCHRCEIGFNPNEKFFSKKGGCRWRYHINCAIQVNLLDEKYAKEGNY